MIDLQDMTSFVRYNITIKTYFFGLNYRVDHFKYDYDKESF